MSVGSCPPPLMFCAGDSPAKTSAAETTTQLDLLESVPVSGASTAGSSKRSSRRSSSSKTSHPVRVDGCPTCGEICTCWGTEPVPTRFLPPTSGRRFNGDASSWLPTLTAKGNLLSPSMQKWAAHRRLRRCAMLPTLTASSYGSNMGGAAGRVGPLRPSLRSLAGGPLNPRWCEWYQGFPVGWCVLSETP